MDITTTTLRQEIPLLGNGIVNRKTAKPYNLFGELGISAASTVTDVEVSEYSNRLN